MPDYPEELHVERHNNGVVVATLNRPEVLNAFNGALRIGIKELVSEVKQDSSVRALVLTGREKRSVLAPTCALKTTDPGLEALRTRNFPGVLNCWKCPSPRSLP